MPTQRVGALEWVAVGAAGAEHVLEKPEGKGDAIVGCRQPGKDAAALVGHVSAVALDSEQRRQRSGSTPSGPSRKHKLDGGG